MRTEVVNISKSKCDIYIGRREHGMHYGNPAGHKKSDIAVVKTKSRKQAITFYKDWLDGKYPEIEPERRQWILENMHDLKGKKLGCYCFPLACHGNILVEMLEGAEEMEYDDRAF